jgi:hypothetical protein
MPRLTTSDLRHPNRHMPAFGAALLAGLLLSACAGATSSPTPSATPSPSVEPSSDSLPSLSPAIGCLDSPPDVEVLSAQADPAGCFGSDPLTFDAYMAGGAAVDCPIVVEPTYLSCPTVLVQLVGETRKVGAPFLLVAFDPASPISTAGFTNARVTGHFDDPAAQMCHETERAPAIGGTPQPMAETIAQCRRTFVVTEIVPLDL